MWRELIAVLLGSLLLFFRAGIVEADSSLPQDTIQMTGEAMVDNSQQQPRLLFEADANNGSGWHLEVVLTPRATRSRNENPELGLSGQFALTRSGSTTITGIASGQLSRRGDGSLQLANQAGTVQLDASFSTDDTGQLHLDLNGQFPSSSDPQSTATTQAQPTDHTFWYLSRATGFSAYLVLFLNVCLGLLISSLFSGPLLARWQSFDLHQFTGLLALGLTALHGLSLLGDRYFGFTVGQISLPFTSPYRPFWTTLGILSFYSLAVVVASYYVRQRIGYSAWRKLHYMTFGLFVMALGHSVMSGTDASEPWAAIIYWGTGAIVAILTLRRFSDPDLKQPAQTRPIDYAWAREIRDRFSNPDLR
ncbi:MAG: ferric reductase-like transmembrane domain-containing protein [Chloroflexi bacterium]|nr:ferric reductase-like transmembrane domain-containing protein [Chloroflexota bacterium]